MKLTVKNVRLAFPDLWVATTVKGEGKPAFGASFLLPKDHPQVAAIKEAIKQTAVDKWGAKADQVLKASKAKDRYPLHDGDTKAQYSGYEGNLYISARNASRPKVRDRDGTTDLTQADGKPYSGCYVNAVLEFYAQNNSYGQHVNATLLGVQFIKDGEAFAGGGTAADDDFEDMGADTEAEDELF